MKIITSPTGDKCIYIKHPSGLDIYVCEMEGFSTVEALFATKYGSIDTMFKTSADEKYTEVPDGIAHFLEHKLFENEDSDVFELYAKTGACGNAYTSFDSTCYLFNCSQNYLPSLEILLDFVQNPYFTPESVEKEQGIIGQEIKMCDDTPQWIAYFNLLKNLYTKHPIRINIAGTVQSIAQIDADLLYKCYNTFYNLNNMVLAVAGNVKVDEIIELCDRMLKPNEDNGLESVYPDEPDEILESEVTAIMPVGIPMFCIGYKCFPKEGKDKVKAHCAAYLLSNILTGDSSNLYKRLLEEGLINNSFGSEILNGSGYFSILFEGESSDPRKVCDEITAEFERAKKEGLNREHFDWHKKAAYGAQVRSLNNVETVAGLMLGTALDETGVYDSIQVFAEITYDDIMEFLNTEIRSDKVVLSVVKGKEKGKAK